MYSRFDDIGLPDKVYVATDPHDLFKYLQTIPGWGPGADIMQKCLSKLPEHVTDAELESMLLLSEFPLSRACREAVTDYRQLLHELKNASSVTDKLDILDAFAAVAKKFLKTIGGET